MDFSDDDNTDNNNNNINNDVIGMVIPETPPRTTFAKKGKLKAMNNNNTKINKKKSSNWKEQSNMLRQAIKQSKLVSNAIKNGTDLSLLPPLPYIVGRTCSISRPAPKVVCFLFLLIILPFDCPNSLIGEIRFKRLVDSGDIIFGVLPLYIPAPPPLPFKEGENVYGLKRKSNKKKSSKKLKRNLVKNLKRNLKVLKIN